MKQKRFLLTASMLLATAFTFYCSDGGGSDGGRTITETYSLLVNDGSFTYTESYEDYYCDEGGEIVDYSGSYPQTIYYSIANNVLEWDTYWYGKGQDTLNFSGTSNNLTGTWTRTKNKGTSCYLDYDYYECKEGWDITKAEFTVSTVKITRDYCGTDTEVDGSEWGGWKLKITGCETAEFSKGSEKLKIQETQSSFKITYNGKTCTYYEPNHYSLAQHKNACKKAWELHGDDWYWDEYYYDYLYADYYECVKSFPIFGYDDDDYYYKSLAAKPLKKGTKFSMLKRAKQ